MILKMVPPKCVKPLPDNQVEGVVFYPGLFKVIESECLLSGKWGNKR
ncbi:hypothetical protein ACFPVS_03120 [Neisseria weixii]|nr:hypothetical protein [Neisseria weixii]